MRKIRKAMIDVFFRNTMVLTKKVLLNREALSSLYNVLITFSLTSFS